MKALLEAREMLQKFYANFSIYIIKILQFILGLMTFSYIGRTIGYFSALANSVVILGLSIVCMFLPISWTVFIAGVLILGHMFKVSLIVMGMTAIVLVLIYIFYFRFATMYSWVVLVTPVACVMHLPFVVPLVLGFVSFPVSAFAAVIGVFMYYFLQFLGSYGGSSSSGVTEMISEAGSFVKAAFINKEMWTIMIVMVLIALVVMVVNILLDVLYAYLNPRIRRSMT